MKKLKEFKKYDKKQSLNEIYQQSGMRFAFMSSPKDGSQQSCPWVKCRDYLHDAFRAYLHKKSCAIYGFSYNYATDPPIDFRRIRMLVKHTSKKKTAFKKCVINGVKLINHYERIAGLKQLSKRYEVNPGIWIVNGPNFWLKSPALTSMFTFLLRLGELGIKFKNNEDLEAQFKKHADPEGDNDAQYLYKTWDKMATIVKNYEDIFLNGKKYEKCVIQKKGELSIDSYHNYMGIVSLCNGNYKNKAAYDKLEKLLKRQVRVVEEILVEKPEKKVKNKQLLRIETPYNKSIYDNYDPSSFYATTISSPKKGREQCSQFTNCRELMIASIRASLSELDNNKIIEFTYRKTGGPQTDLAATRFLVTVTGVDSGKGKIKKAWNELFFAKKVMNTYEDFFGIDKTVISTVKLKHKEGLSTAWLFTSSKEWGSNPVMFSIYVMLIRASKNAAGTIGTINDPTMDKLSSYWKKFYGYVGDKNKDSFLHLNYGDIISIIANRDVLFTKSAIEAYFSGNGLGNTKYYKSVGVSALIDGSHLDGDLVKKYKQLKQ